MNTLASMNVKTCLLNVGDISTPDMPSLAGRAPLARTAPHPPERDARCGDGKTANICRLAVL